MRLYLTKKQISLVKSISPIMIFLSLVIFIPKIDKPTLKVSEEDRAINFDTNLIRVFSLGQKRMISSYLWIITLLNSDTEHYQFADENSWMSLRFRTIEFLEPNFYENYNFGGRYLSIIKDDIAGGFRLLKNGVIKFPEDFRLRQYLAFIYQYEIKMSQQALSHYRILLNHPKQAELFSFLPNIVESISKKGSSIQSQIDDELLLNLLKDENNNDLFIKRYLEKIKNKDTR